MTRHAEHSIMLAVITNEILDKLVVAATTDAAADEVTPPLSPGAQWTQERVDWLRNYHLANREGAAELGREFTWAVMKSGIACGSVRLKATEAPNIFETGIWLTQTARGQGVGRAILDVVIKNAAEQGAHELRADTAAGNSGALRLLENLRFQIGPADKDGRVQARLAFHPKVRQRL